MAPPIMQADVFGDGNGTLFGNSAISNAIADGIDVILMQCMQPQYANKIICNASRKLTPFYYTLLPNDPLRRT